MRIFAFFPVIPYRKAGGVMSKEPQVDAQEMLEKYDRESQFRSKIGRWAWIVTFLGVSLTIFQLYVGYFGTIQSQKQGAVHLGTALGIIFLLYPAKKGQIGRASCRERMMIKVVEGVV